MPGMDGFEFCRRVRNHSLLRQTPLVFLSEWDDYRERYHGLTLGADDYLSTRTPPREMLIRMQIILRRYTTSARKGAGMQGGLEVIGAPGMRRGETWASFSGTCTVRSGRGGSRSASGGRDRRGPVGRGHVARRRSNEFMS